MRKLILSLGLTSVAALAASNPPATTYYKDALPVLQKNCQGCHRPGEAAPMSFLTYDQTRPWAKGIRAAVLTKKMPPWFADAHYGKFTNDRSLSQKEIDTLVAWADGGAKEGKAEDAPRPIEFVEGWSIGKPDVVLEMPVDFDVPASGTIEYQYIILPTNFTEDKWVQMAEARPGNRKLTHHIIAFIREPGSNFMKGAPLNKVFSPKGQEEKKQQRPQAEGKRQQRQDDDAAFGGSEFLVGYAPGSPAEVLRPGQGKLVKAGSDIVFQLHYTANGTAGKDHSKIGLVFATSPVDKRVMTVAAQTTKFAIPAGAASHPVPASITLHADSELLTLLPHMHLRGKAMTYKVVYPTGESEVLLSVPKYDFSWQLWYELDKPKMLPKGTKIEVVGVFDNSANNPANPDPNKEVHWGEQSWEEMMMGFFDVAIDVKMNPVDLFRPKQPVKADD
jgi:hypothetical protein